MTIIDPSSEFKSAIEQSVSSISTEQKLEFAWRCGLLVLPVFARNTWLLNQVGTFRDKLLQDAIFMLDGAYATCSFGHKVHGVPLTIPDVDDDAILYALTAIRAACSAANLKGGANVDQEVVVAAVYATKGVYATYSADGKYRGAANTVASLREYILDSISDDELRVPSLPEKYGVMVRDFFCMAERKWCRILVVVFV